MTGIVYLIPSTLHNDELALRAIPLYITDAIKSCDVFFAENEKTTRRYFKKLWCEMVIDNYEWHTIHKAEAEVKNIFIKRLSEGKNIGIISEAGCPGIADPGQVLIAAAQQMGAVVKPLVGPNSILLALMASGMSGQQFSFHGYLPIDNVERKKKIKELEEESATRNATQLFIETPYRNNAMFQDILQACKPTTALCIAAEITGSNEVITTKTIAQWKHKEAPQLHKIPVMFLLYAGR